MISIKILRREELLLGITVEGHAQYEATGRDIVCAAVSTLIQALEVGLRDVMRFSDTAVQIERKDSRGYMCFSWTVESGIGDSVLFQTILRSLWSIRRGYPKNICIKEVSFDEGI